MSDVLTPLQVEFFTAVHTGDSFRVGVRCWRSMPNDVRFALIDSTHKHVALHQEKVTGTRVAQRISEGAAQKVIRVPEVGRREDGSVTYWPRFTPHRGWKDNEPLQLWIFTANLTLGVLRLPPIARRTHSSSQVTMEMLAIKLQEIASLKDNDKEELDGLSADHWQLVVARSFLLSKMLNNDTAYKRPVRADEDEVLKVELSKGPDRFAAFFGSLIQVGRENKAWEEGHLLLISDETACRQLTQPGDFLLRPSYSFANERVLLVNAGGGIQKLRVPNLGPVPILTLKYPCKWMVVFAANKYEALALNDVPKGILAGSPFIDYPRNTAPQGEGQPILPPPATQQMPPPPAPLAPPHTPAPGAPAPAPPAPAPASAPLVRPFSMVDEWPSGEPEECQQRPAKKSKTETPPEAGVFEPGQEEGAENRDVLSLDPELLEYFLTLQGGLGGEVAGIESPIHAADNDHRQQPGEPANSEVLQAENDIGQTSGLAALYPSFASPLTCAGGFD